MKKEDKLAGIAQTLANNFISENNMLFLKYIASFPEEKRGVIKINLLTGEVIPKEINGSHNSKHAQYVSCPQKFQG